MIIVNKKNALRICLFLLLFGVFNLSCVWAGRSAQIIDSLQRHLEKPGMHDTIYLNTHLRLSWELKSSNPTLALEHAQQALDEAIRKNLKSKMATAYSYIGVIYWQMGSFNLALDYQMEAYRIFQEIDDQTGIARSSTNLGVALADKSHYEKALEYYFTALRIYEGLDSESGMAVVMNNIGLVYQYQGDYELAQRYHFRSLDIKQKLNDIKGMAFSYNNLGLVYQSKGDLDTALTYAFKSLEIREQLADQRELANVCTNIGYIYFLKNEHLKAQSYMNRAIELYREVDDKSGITTVFHYLGKVYLQDNQLTNARLYFQQSLEIASQISFNRMITENYQHLSLVMARLNNFKEAYDYQGKFLALKDSFYNEDSRRKVYEMQLLYERERRESDDQLLRKNEQITVLSSQKHRVIRNGLIIGVTLVLVLVFVIYNRFLVASRSNALLEKQKEEISQSNAQLVRLNNSLLEQKKHSEELFRQLQDTNKKLVESERHLIETNATKDKFFSIISHDLRNPFASIVSFSRILKRDIQNLSPEDIQELALELDKSVLKIDNLLENLLQWSRTQTGKIKYQPEYLALHEVIRDNIQLFANNAREKEITITDQVMDDLVVWADLNMTDSVIRNLLSNALKYTDSGGLIELSGRVEAGMAYISVRDNGVGMSAENQAKLFRPNGIHSTYGTHDEKGSGIGLLLCKEFVEKQGGKISFESTRGEGSVFIFSLPLESTAAKFA